MEEKTKNCPIAQKTKTAHLKEKYYRSQKKCLYCQTCANYSLHLSLTWNNSYNMCLWMDYSLYFVIGEFNGMQNISKISRLTKMSHGLSPPDHHSVCIRGHIWAICDPSPCPFFFFTAKIEILLAPEVVFWPVEGPPGWTGAINVNSWLKPHTGIYHLLHLPFLPISFWAPAQTNQHTDARCHTQLRHKWLLWLNSAAQTEFLHRARIALSFITGRKGWNDPMRPEAVR